MVSFAQLPLQQCFFSHILNRPFQTITHKKTRNCVANLFFVKPPKAFVEIGQCNAKQYRAEEFCLCNYILNTALQCKSAGGTCKIQQTFQQKLRIGVYIENVLKAVCSSGCRRWRRTTAVIKGVVKCCN